MESKRVFTYWQENAWNNQNIVLKWISEVCRKYSFLGLKWRTLWVLDNATNHKTSKVKEKFKECDASLSIILSGLTWKLQPLYISIIKVLKENLRKRYVNDGIKTNNAKVSKSTIIEFLIRFGIQSLQSRTK